MVVAPRAGAWIETFRGYDFGADSDRSRPVRARGLKQATIQIFDRGFFVAPRAGAWIETFVLTKDNHNIGVAPRAGAWIETR